MAWSRGTNGYTATWMDDPNMAGTPRRTENNAPYDFAGSTVSTANPFKTASVAKWSHTITAAVELTEGTIEVVYATFVVNN